METNDRVKRRRSCRAIAWGGAALVGLWAPAWADSPVFFRFTEIARSGSNLADFSPGPALSNDGSVAFRAFRSDGTTRILRGDGGPRTTIADTAEGFFTSLGAPSINGSGDVAFSDRERGVFRFSDGVTIAIAEPGHFSAPSGAFDRFYDASIDDDGRVFFRSFLGRIVGGVFWGTGGPTTAVRIKARSEGLITNVAANNVGRVAFWDHVPTTNDDFDTRLLLTAINLPQNPETIAAEGSDGVSELSGYTYASVNDFGRVAFGGFLDNGVRGIFSGSGGAITTVADSTGQFSHFSIAASIDSGGTVAFAATLDAAAGSGVFVGPDPVLDRVIGSGDRIGNRTVSGASIGPEGLNDREQIALFVSFTNGRTAILRADPLGTSLPADPIKTMQMTTGTGTSSSAAQTMPAPLGSAELSVDLKFLTSTGELVFRVLDDEVGRIAAPSYPQDAFTTSTIAVDLRGLSSGQLAPEWLPLSVELTGPPGSTVQIDEIDFPGLSNGDFERGYLDGWEVDTRDGGAVMAVMALPAPD